MADRSAAQLDKIGKTLACSTGALSYQAAALPHLSVPKLWDKDSKPKHDRLEIILGTRGT